MKNGNPQRTDNDSLKWGYAIAGACALGFAALIQIAFDSLDETALERLPAFVTIPYGIAGKLGITIPLAALGLGLILRDVLVHRNATVCERGAGALSRLARASRTSDARSAPVAGTEENLEVGEPLQEAAPAAPAGAKPAPKIAAVARGFGGRGGSAPESIPGKTGGPVGDSTPAPQRPGSGQIELSSAKYLNRNPGGSFRRGTIQHTQDE